MTKTWSSLKSRHTKLKRSNKINYTFSLRIYVGTMSPPIVFFFKFSATCINSKIPACYHGNTAVSRIFNVLNIFNHMFDLSIQLRNLLANHKMLRCYQLSLHAYTHNGRIHENSINNNIYKFVVYSVWFWVHNVWFYKHSAKTTQLYS